MEDRIRKGFKEPAPEYLPASFWSWNGSMEKDEIAFQLKDFIEHGIGGGYAHPRAGMITEYLSEEYFDRIKFTLEESVKLGMKMYLYDEYGWPSGFAGGKVVEKEPSTVGPLAKYKIKSVDEMSFPGNPIFAAVYEEKDGKVSFGKILTDIPKDEWVNLVPGCDIMAIYYVTTDGGNWTGEYPYVNLLNPLATKTFLELTYDEYYKAVGEEFGKTILSIFSDEANVNTDGLITVPFTKELEDAFREKYGYDLRPNLPGIFKSIGSGLVLDRPVEKIRYDYFDLIHDLWLDSFVKPIAKWCEEHNIAWTGHDIEHQWPQAHGGRMIPSEQTTYEYRQWPGFDLLLCEHLKDTPSNFDKFLMYEIRSVANQLEKKRTLCESFGAGGFDSTVYDYKRLGDFLLVGGINSLVLHLSLFSYLGARKRDCPQSFDFRQPWWDEYTEVAKYTGRLSFVLSEGKMEQRILLMNTSTTSYVLAPEEESGNVDHALDVDCVKNPDMSDFLTIVNELTDEQWDFDISDEFTFSRHAKSKGKKLEVGAQSYDVVVISKNMLNMRKETVDILCDFISGGGTVVTTDSSRSSFAKYIDGEEGKDDSLRIRKAVETVDGAEKICPFIERHCERRILSSEGWKRGVQIMRRVYSDGRACYFIVNHSMGESFETVLSVRGDSVNLWDPWSGEVKGIRHSTHDGWVDVPVKIDRCGSLLLMTGEKTVDAKEERPADKKAELELVSIEKEGTNTFTLDHPELEIDGKVFPPRYYLETTANLFHIRIGTGDPWNTMQPKTVFLDKNKEFKEGSGFTARYRFDIDPGVLPCQISASIERPELYKITCNGKEVSEKGRDFLDRGLIMFDISGSLKEGENIIELTADKFNILCELEGIILRGEFAVKPGKEYFKICPREELRYGNWSDMGLTFYSGALNYTYKTVLESRPERAVIKAPEDYATAVGVYVNGKHIGLLGRDGGSCLDIADALGQGENDIRLRVCGSLRNLYGPYLEYKDFCAYDWSFFKRGKHAKVSDYEFREYGLKKDPELFIS